MRIRIELENLEKYISNICLASLLVVLALQVFFRYVLQTGLSWSEEVSRFLFIWFVYISASYAVQKGTHIRVSIVSDLLPPAMRFWMSLLADAVWIGFNGLVIVSGIMLVDRMMQHPVYSTSLLLPLSYIYLVIPVAHAAMIFRILQARFRPGSKAKHPDQPWKER